MASLFKESLLNELEKVWAGNQEDGERRKSEMKKMTKREMGRGRGRHRRKKEQDDEQV